MAGDAELEMMYTLSNGLMHVVVEAMISIAKRKSFALSAEW